MFSAIDCYKLLICLCLNVCVVSGLTFLLHLTEELPGSCSKTSGTMTDKAAVYHRSKQNHKALNTSLL